MREEKKQNFINGYFNIKREGEKGGKNKSQFTSQASVFDIVGTFSGIILVVH